MPGLQVSGRPQSFGEMAGNDTMLKMAERIMAREQAGIQQCWFLSGPPGTGKTTIARILAKMFGCAPGDILEHDSAKNNSVNDVRDLHDRSQPPPLSGGNQAFILDEFHFFGKAAVAASLKMLEEVQSHTIFFICTSEPDVVPDAIKSRGTSLVTSRLSENETKHHLQGLLLKEGFLQEDLELFDEVIKAIHDKAMGVPRDAVKLLDQVIDEQDIGEMLNIIAMYTLSSGSKSVDSLLSIMLSRGKAKQKWNRAVKALSAPGLQPESMRIKIMWGLMNNLMRNGDEDIALIMELFENNFYSSGMPGLAKAVYQACNLLEG